jgi:hypothetical protein
VTNPRLTGHQRLVINRSDTFLGIDAAGRPVVSKARRFGGGTDTWAVTKQGEPTDVTEPIDPAITEADL